MLFKADLYLKRIFLPTLLLCNTAFYLIEVSLRVDWKCRYYAPLNQNNTEWTYRNLFYEHNHTMKTDGRWISCVTVQEFSYKISSLVDFFHTQNTSFFIFWWSSFWRVPMTHKNILFIPHRKYLWTSCGLNGLFEHETETSKCSNTKRLTT